MTDFQFSLPSLNYKPYSSSFSYENNCVSRIGKMTNLSHVNQSFSIKKKQVELSKNPSTSWIKNYLIRLSNSNIKMQKYTLKELCFIINQSKSQWTSDQCWLITDYFLKCIELKPLSENVFLRQSVAKLMPKIIHILINKLAINDKKSWFFIERFFINLIKKNTSDTCTRAYIINILSIPKIIESFNNRNNLFTNTQSHQIISWIFQLMEGGYSLTQAYIASEVLPNVIRILKVNLKVDQNRNIVQLFLAHLVSKGKEPWTQIIIIERLPEFIQMMRTELNNKQFYMILVAIIGNEEGRSNLTYLTEMVYHVVLALNPSFTDQQCKKFSNHLIKIGDSLAELNNPNNLIKKNYMSKL